MKSLLTLVDSMFHQKGNTDENGAQIDDNLCFVIRKVFEAKSE